MSKVRPLTSRIVVRLYCIYAQVVIQKASIYVNIWFFFFFARQRLKGNFKDLYYVNFLRGFNHIEDM